MRHMLSAIIMVMVSWAGSATADVALHPAREVMSRFAIAATSPNADRIAATWDVVEADDEELFVLVSHDQALNLLAIEPTARLVAADDLFFGTDFDSIITDDGKIAGYRSIDEVYSHLLELAGRNPSIVRLIQFGTSRGGRPQYALKISDNPDEDEPEPEIMITAATHGDELITVEMLLGLIDDLVTNYKGNSRYQAMIDERELFFIPVVSPDGFATQSRHVGGVDPNRNFPWPEQESVTSIRSIQNLRDFFEEREIEGAIDYHAFGEMIMYPWAYTRSAPPIADERRFEEIGRSMAEHNGYSVGQISRIIYVAKGSSADYWYWKNNTIALGIEVATSKVPPASAISRVIDDNRESTWRFIESF